MPVTSADIGFGLFDVTAKADTTVTASRKASFIDLQDLTLDGVYPPKAATLETDYWKLDGTFDVFPDEPENTTWGYWSPNLSGSTGSFALSTYIILTMGSLHESIGISFEFNPYDNSYCDYLRIRWYRGSTVIDSGYYRPDNWRYTVSNKVTNYNKIRIDFYSVNKAYRYLKIQNIAHGEYQFFSSADVISASILEEVDLTSTELSVNTLDFSVYSQDERFNIWNPSGLYDLLQKKQQLVVDGWNNGVLVPFGNYYVDTWEAEDVIMSISATDAIGVMDTTLFNGGMYTAETVLNLVDEVMTDAGFGYTVDTEIGAKTLTGWIPRCSHREALQQIAFAAGAYVDTSRGGMVAVRAIDETIRGELGRDRKFTGSRATLKSYVSEVDLTVHQYVVGPNATDLFNGDLPLGESEVAFSKPGLYASIDLEESTGAGTVTERGVNYCKVNITTAGTIVIRGRPYEDNTTIQRAQVPEMEAGEKEGIINITDATLISDSNAEEIAERLLEYYQLRVTQDLSFVLGNEVPGGGVTVETEEDVWRDAAVLKLETDLSGGFITKAVVLSG